MNILITNDDGIQSEGLARLARAARKFGEVWVLAPDSERSAKSHAITLRRPVIIHEVKDYPVEGVHAYMSDGTPADCVRHGTRNIVKGQTDLVLAGINSGYNCGSDIQYSATVGAAMEGACEGYHSIAVSEDFQGSHEVTDAYLERLLEEYIKAPLGRNEIWNINFPSCGMDKLKGILRNTKVAENAFYIDSYTEEPMADGGVKMCIHGNYHENAAEGTDFRAIVDGYISVGRVRNLRHAD